MAIPATADFAAQTPFTRLGASAPPGLGGPPLPNPQPTGFSAVIPSQAVVTDHMTLDWPIRALHFSAHCDWFVCGHVTQIKPIRTNAG